MDINKKKQYTKIKHILMITDIFYSFILFIGIFMTGLTYIYRDISHIISNNFYIQIALYTLFLSLTLYMLTIPFDFFSSFIIEHKFSLSNQTFKAWFKDNIKKNILSFIIMLPLIELMYFCLKAFPYTWWIYISLIFILVTIILGKIAPVIIIPLFYKYKDIEDEQLKTIIFNLSKKTGTKIKDIFEIDFSRETKKANAALTGLGNTRRVLLTDNLIKNFSHDEIESVLAHEIGHHKHNHILKQLIIGSIMTFIGFYFCNLILQKAVPVFNLNYLHDIAGLPLIGFIFFIFSLLIMPIQNIYSRALEIQADKFALDNIKSKLSFTSSMQKLADLNLSDEEPNKIIEFLFYSHPSIKKRID